MDGAGRDRWTVEFGLRAARFPVFALAPNVYPGFFGTSVGLTGASQDVETLTDVAFLYDEGEAFNATLSVNNTDGAISSGVLNGEWRAPVWWMGPAGKVGDVVSPQLPTGRHTAIDQHARFLGTRPLPVAGSVREVQEWCTPRGENCLLRTLLGGTWVTMWGSHPVPELERLIAALRRVEIGAELFRELREARELSRKWTR